jgi:hypothetical protein
MGCLVTLRCAVQADKPKPKPKAPPSCGDNKERRDCLKVGAEEGDCAWCEGDFMPASCVGVKAAEWIPEQVGAAAAAAAAGLVGDGLLCGDYASSPLSAQCGHSRL